MRHRAVYKLEFDCVSQYSFKMYWKEILTIKGSAIYHLAN